MSPNGIYNNCSGNTKSKIAKRMGNRRIWVHFGQREGAIAGSEIISNTKRTYPIFASIKGLDKQATTCNEKYVETFDYTDYVNAWTYANDLVFEKTCQRQQLYEGYRIWEYERVMYVAKRIVRGYGFSTSLKNAKQMCNYAITDKYIHQACVQMDGDTSKESVQGLAIQDSDKASNTIVTRDEDKTVSRSSEDTKPIEFVSTEKVISFNDVTNRWMPLKSLVVSTANTFDTLLQSYYLPETLYTEMGDAANLLPFEAFIYGKYKIIMKFVVNANKFQCGKLLVSAKFDSYQADAMQSSVLSGLARPHIMLDLASNVEGELEIPFKYHRSLLRNVKNDNATVGVRSAKYASVYVHVLSPLRTGTGGLTDLYIRPYVKITEADFAAMSYRVKVQMDTLVPMLKQSLPTSELKEVLGGAERLLKTIGETANRDKPTHIGNQIFVPHPRLNFCPGKGLIDAIPLRNNPYALTTFSHVKPYEDEPKTTLDIAQIWGLRTVSTWRAAHKPGEVILDMLIDPTVRQYNEGYEGTPTPLEYVSGLYQFWAGTIELRLDFISNAFHTGTVMISAEFGRPSDSTTEAEHRSASTYTKTFHLGEQKSCTFTVPYIYDTVWRRSNNLPYQPLINKPATSDLIKNNQCSIRADSYTKVRVRVINELRPVQTASQEIEILAYWRGSPEFMLHGLKQSSWYLTREVTDEIPALDNFPLDGYKPVTPPDTNRAKRSAEELETQEDIKKYIAENNALYELKKKIHDVPVDISNSWNERRADKIKVQMDTGDKEAEDSTVDFNRGRFNLGLQTTDTQTSIKDILRRPVMLVNNYSIKGYGTGKATGFFIPLQPPSRELQWHPKANTNFCYLIGQTPQAALMNLFRFWRGSQRYTIVVRGRVDNPVYVTAMPHSGVRMLGNRQIAQAINVNECPIAACGLPTEMIIPSVNPTAVFEIAYDTINDWTLTFEEDAQRNYAWRDKGDYNCGHLIISCSSNISVDVWWSAGDDFEVANFYGIPACKKDDHLYQWNDSHARVQMDFNNEDTSYLRRTISVLKSATAPAILASVPVVGNALAVGYGAHKLNKTLTSANQALQSWDNVGKEMQKTLTKVDEVTDTCSDILTILQQKMTTILDNIVAGTKILPSVRQIVENLLLDIVAAWFSKSWSVVGVGLVRVVNQIVGGSVHVFHWGLKLAQVIKTMVSGDAYVQAPPTTEATMTGILCGLVGSLLNVTLNSSDFKTFQTQLTRVFTTTQGISYLNQVLRFVQLTFECVKELVLKALGLVDPEVAAIRLLCENSAQMKQFIADAQLCMNEANAGIMAAPSFRRKYWAVTVQAYQYQKALLAAGTNIASPAFVRFCQDVIKNATEKFMDLSCSPVRHEPFVVCISGKPGIGKSYMTNTLIMKMLERINFNRVTSGLTYTRAPGSKYWSSYRDQPAIVYDDWLNLNSAESIEQQISELYQLKSTCRFIPEMAHLEEKKMSANPIIVMLVCNDPFPTSMSGVAIHTEAVYRRRDIVIDVRLKREWQGKNLRDDLTEEQSMNLEHLEFTVYADSKNKNTKYATYKPFEEFCPWFLQNFERYHKQEIINVRKRVDELQNQLQMSNLEALADPFELLYTTQELVAPINQNAWTPAEQLEAAVHQLITVVDAVETRPPVIIPPKPDPIFTQVEWQTLTKLIATVGTAAITTPSMMAYLMETTWEQLMHLMPTTNVINVTEVGRCCVCLAQDQPLVMMCSNGTEDNPHKWCIECYRRSSIIAPMVNCPMCRGSDIRMLETEQATWWITVAKWIVRNGREYVRPFINVITQVMRMLPTRVYCWVEILVTWIRFVHNPSVVIEKVLPSVVTLATDMYMRPETDVFTEAANFPTAVASSIINTSVQVEPEMEWDMFIPPPQEPENPVQPTSLFQVVEFRDDLWENYKVTSTKSLCMHHELLAQANIAKYIYNPESQVSEWQVTAKVNNQVLYIMVEDGICSENCPMNDIVAVKNFYKTYTRVNQAILTTHLVAVHNNSGELANRARRLLPRMVQPRWMDVPEIPIPEGNWWEYLGNKYEQYKTLINVCLGVASVTAGLMALGKLWDYWQAPSIQGDLNYNASEARQLRRIVQPRRIQPQRLRVQADDLYNTVIESVIKNYVICKIWKNNEVQRQLVLTGICGKFAIMPKHYIGALNGATGQITIEPALYVNGDKNHLRQIYAYDVTDVMEMSNTDLAFIKLPNTYPSFKDIRKFFQTEEDLAGYYPNEGEILLVPTRRRQALMIKNVDILGITPRVKFDDIDGSTFWVSDVLKYTHSEEGACGSIVMVENHQRPLRAMHVAGTCHDVGYGVLITRQLLDELTQDKVILQYEESRMENIADRDDAICFSPDIRVDYLGALEKNKVPFIPKKSKIRPSVIQSILPEPVTAPAILHAQDARYTHEKSPLWYGAAKHGKVTTDFTATVVDDACEALWDKIIKPMKPAVLQPKRMTIEQAITGLNGVNYYDPMRLDTSAGYPWQLQGDKTTKREWCSYERNAEGEFENIQIHPDLRTEIMRKENMRKKGIVPLTMFVDTLKDERKMKHKVVKQGGTRVFCASPIDYTIATRQNLLHFCASFMKTRFNAWHAVGINAKGPEWTELYRQLTAISATNIVMMDYSNFGPGFNGVVAEKAAELIIRWTMSNVEGVDEHELKALLTECINSVHIAGPTVYRQFAGSPSGAAITTVINTLVNLMYLTISWKALAGQRAKQMHPDIYHVLARKTKIVAYGDDFIMAVHDDFKDVFNTNTIRNFLAQNGIAATSAEKDLIVMPDFVPIGQASFLKRTFRKHDTRPEMILGPLDEQALKEIPKWIWQCSDKKQATRVNVESALLEAHAYGPQYFKDMKDKLNDALIRKKIETVSMQWKDLDDQWFKAEMPIIELLD